MNARIKSDFGLTSRLGVAILTNIPTPYRLPFFEELSHLCNLTVLFDGLSEPNRQWAWNDSDFRFQCQFLKGFLIPYTRRRGVNDRRFLQFRYNIISRLFRLRPDVVVSAEMGPRSIQAELYCRLTKTPLVIWWEGTPHTERAPSTLRLLIRRYLIQQAARFWSNGRESTALLNIYGADPAKIDAGMTGIDTMELASRVKQLLPGRAQIRSELGVNGTVILYVGQFADRKGILQYLRALDLIHSGTQKWSLLFVGAGALEADLRKWAVDHPEVLIVTGFIQPAELPRYLCAADIFVMPTLDDNWPLAPLEALVAGLPQLFSIYNGGTADLLVPGITGELVDPTKADEFAAAMSAWIERPPNRIPSNHLAEIIKYYSPAEMAQRGLISLKRAVSSDSSHTNSEAATD
jgi:glycosyltransferase involved in cell wall biosynthesis